MKSRVHNSPNLIYSVGTQVVALKAVRKSHNSLQFIRTMAGLLAVVLGLMAADSEATIYRTLRLESDPVILDGCVLFAQGIGSLTKLDLATGEVLVRKAPGELRYGGVLRPHRLGMVMVDYSDVALLNPDTFEVAWHVSDAHEAAIGDDRFLVSDGNQTVTCHRLADGEPVWSVEMPGGWQLSAEGNLGVVSTPEIYDQQHALKAIRLDSGQEAFTVVAEPRERFLGVYQAGETVYVLTYSGDVPSIDRPPPTALVELGPDGERVRSIDYASPQIISERGDKKLRSGFYFEGRYFSGWKGSREVYDYEPDQVVNAWKREDVYPEPLKAGLLLDRGVTTPAGDRHSVLEFASRQASWVIYPSQLQETGGIGRFAEGEGCLVFSSMNGHVECIDLATGESRWIYVFPLIRRGKAFYSDTSGSFADGVAESALGPTRPRSVRGSITLPIDVAANPDELENAADAAAYGGRVVFDPSPDNPRHWVPAHISILGYGLSVVPTVVLLGVLGVLKSRRRNATAEHRHRVGILSAQDWKTVARTAEAMFALSLFGALFTLGILEPVSAWQAFNIPMCLVVTVFSHWKSGRVERAVNSTRPTRLPNAQG